MALEREDEKALNEWRLETYRLSAETKKIVGALNDAARRIEEAVKRLEKEREEGR